MSENIVLHGDVGPIADLPYGRILHGVYRRLVDKRLKVFLRGLGTRTDEMTADEKARFEAYMMSEDGQDLLADFADKAIRTRSTTAIAATAILYASPVDLPLHADFKAEAAQAFQGVSELAIHTFLTLMREVRAGAIRPVAETGVLVVSADILKSISSLAALGHSRETWAKALEELIRRGFVTRPTQSTWAGGEAEWEYFVVLTAESALYADLLDRGRVALGLSSILDSPA